MGLFDFAKEIGQHLFEDDDAAAAEKIKQHIETSNPGIKDLFVIYKHGKATLLGVTNDPEAAQKAILMTGNVKGVVQVISKMEVNDPETGVELDIIQAFEPEGVEYYLVQPGDSLSKIAKFYYQDASLYTRIFAANKEVIKDPDLIYPGQKIRIPL